MARRLIKGKMHAHALMQSHPGLAKRLPTLRWMNRSTLVSMLNQYGMVYIKPNLGSQGNGVIRVEKHPQHYKFHAGTAVSEFRSYDAMYAALAPHTRRKPYVVQKGIHVLRHKGRPFDFRVMIQRNPKRDWECTGIFGRLAHPGKAVTNGSQGGTIYEPSALLAPRAGTSRTPYLLRIMNRLAYKTAATLSSKYPQLNELGLDICLDRKLNPWILEVNTIPDPKPFTLLPNPRMLSRIIAYGRAYGRRYNLKVTKARKA
ncbi:YheC/YheD family protein [Paenibacillus sp. 7541]|uniref:YheC/YheD family protein n=1 Tax=Paenibacillus sp. 7541 TaxID=2026236 RepID=UPI000BA77EF0|nr:YheC/YheD family protein [Paenibacillus sp. 7541]PAK50080.1 hypothetical protein CHH75_19200 [Paenibacillus sp. 7541]